MEVIHNVIKLLPLKPHPLGASPRTAALRLSYAKAPLRAAPQEGVVLKSTLNKLVFCLDNPDHLILIL